MNWIKYLCFLIFIASCKERQSKDQFIKDKSGMEFKLYETGAGGKVREGQFIKMHVKQVYMDSVLNDTRHGLPQYQLMDSTMLSEEGYRIFSQVKPGDSLEFRVVADSAFKNSRSIISKGGWLYTYVKVLGILDGEDEMKVDYEMEKTRLGL